MRIFKLLACLLITQNVLAMSNKYIINAYWYNTPESKDFILKIDKSKLMSGPSLQILGELSDSPIELETKVFQKDGKIVFTKKFLIDSSAKPLDYKVKIKKNGTYKLICKVPHLKQNPSKIVISIKGKNNIVAMQEIECKYYKLTGTIQDFDGNPLKIKTFISIQPDDFDEDSYIGTWPDDNGNYNMDLPARTYNSILAVAEEYGISNLECWGWNILMNSDQTLKLKIGNGEIYNMNVWKNNGGGNSFFISFRPMILLPKDYNAIGDSIKINGKYFKLINYSPVLDLENIHVFVNGIECKVISLQQYFETTSLKQAMPAYIAQVNFKEKLQNSYNQTYCIEFKKSLEYNKIKKQYNGMCYFQINN
jgi:hypothetical protein